MYETKITVSGKEIPIRFGAYVMKCIADEGVKLSELGELIKDNPFDIIPKIFYYGAVNASEGRRGEGISLNDIYDWLDEIPGGLFSEQSQAIIKLFTDQMTEGVPKVEKEEHSKKKQ